MILRSVMRNVRDQNWFAVFLDFLIVVVGVFIGIQVANWNELRREQALERTHLENLRQDFEISLAELSTRQDGLIAIIEAMRALLDVDPSAPPPAHVLNERFSRIQSMPTFNWASRTYDNLIGAGQLRLIDDSEIAEQLAAFDIRVRINALVQQTHEQQLVETFQPWIIKNMDYVAVHFDRLDGEFALPEAREPDQILDLLDDRAFRNVVVQKWMITTDLLQQNRLMQDHVNQLLMLIDRSLDGSASAETQVQAD